MEYSNSVFFNNSWVGDSQSHKPLDKESIVNFFLYPMPKVVKTRCVSVCFIWTGT